MRPFVTLAAAVTLFAAPAAASEIVLYDGPNCSGTHRVLIASEPDLDRVDFGNAAASVRVVAGVWTIYRDDGFQSSNGPSVILSVPGECVTLGQGPYQNFPPELMDSVQLGLPAPGPGAAIVLYDGTNLQGSYRVLTNNTPDLDAVDFDNRIDSFQVLAGAWRIFRDDGFQANQGPPVDAQGTVADIQALGFPRDRASSVMRLNVASDPVPPVAAVQCPQGSAGNGRACADCAGQGLVVAADGASCACPLGQQAIGSRLVNGIPVALCQRELATVTPPTDPDAFERPSCSGDLVSVGSLSGGGGCVPCPEGALPNGTNTQCVCAQGFVQIGIEGTFGQPVCSPQQQGGGQPAQPGVAPADYVVVSGEAVAAARNGRFRFTTLAGGPQLPSSCRVEIHAETNELLVGFSPNHLGGTCDTTVFGERSLREGWSFVSWSVRRAANCDAYTAEIDRIQPQNPRNMEHRIWFSTSPTLVPLCFFIFETITLRGPAGADWRDAFR